MPPTLPSGPLEHLDVGGGRSAPFYVVPFDKHGLCTGPQTRQNLIEAAASGDFSDLFLFSHGWNNDWPTATKRYRDFFARFREAREGAGDLPAEYKPLVVGIFWPSTALVFGEEKGPQFAGGPLAAGAEGDDEAVGAELAAIGEIAEELDPGDRERFYDLASRAELDGDQTQELAELMLPLYRDADDPDEEVLELDAGELAKLWSQLPDQDGATDEPGDDPGAFGMPVFGDAAGEGAGDGPAAAGLLSKLDPRKAVRMFTVWKMKDRAGTVGAKGVGPLLRDLLAAGEPHGLRSHLVGHSYGAKVVLSSICFGSRIADDAVTSLLLLQPAVNFWCFAEDVDGEGFPGGYQPALDVVKLPILTTLSKHDVALRRTFHLAVNRKKKDLGEVLIAGPLKPNRYGGLGGWGPQGCPPPLSKEIPMPKAGQPYPDLLASGSPQILALNGKETVSGHGDVTTPHTAWALLQLVRAGLRGEAPGAGG